MTEKSHVSIEQRLCKVCGKPYDTDSLLLDLRLESTLDRNTVTGWGLCQEHQKLHDEGYIALVEVDPEKSVIRGDSIKSENAHRTGRVAHVRRSFLKEFLTDFSTPDDVPLSFIDKTFMDTLATLHERTSAEEGTTTSTEGEDE